MELVWSDCWILNWGNLIFERLRGTEPVECWIYCPGVNFNVETVFKVWWRYCWGCKIFWLIDWWWQDGKCIVHVEPSTTLQLYLCMMMIVYGTCLKIKKKKYQKNFLWRHLYLSTVWTRQSLQASCRLVCDVPTAMLSLVDEVLQCSMTC